MTFRIWERSFVRGAHISLCDKRCPACWLWTLAPALHPANTLLYLTGIWTSVTVPNQGTYEFGICILNQLSPLPQGRHKAAFSPLSQGSCRNFWDVDSLTVLSLLSEPWTIFDSSVFSPWSWDKRQVFFLSLPKLCKTRAVMAVYLTLATFSLHKCNQTAEMHIVLWNPWQSAGTLLLFLSVLEE